MPPEGSQHRLKFRTVNYKKGEVLDAEQRSEALGRSGRHPHLSAQDIYVVEGGEHQYMIPAVDAFVKGHPCGGGLSHVRPVLEG